MATRKVYIKGLKLRHRNTEDFATSPWLPTAAVLLYRVLFAGYCLGIWIYELFNLRGFYFIYLTHWTFMLMTAYFFCASALSAISLVNKSKDSRPMYVVGNKEDSDSSVDPGRGIMSDDSAKGEVYKGKEMDQDLPFLHQGVWLLHSICANASLMITCGYWAVLYRGQELDIANVSKHLLNAVFMLLDTSLSLVPVRIFHSVYVIGYVITYFVFTFIYWIAEGKDEFGHTYIYRPLDYNKIPVAVLLMLTLFFVAIQPVIQTILFGIYKARSFVYCQFCLKYLNGMQPLEAKRHPLAQSHIPQRVMEDKHYVSILPRCSRILHCKMHSTTCTLCKKLLRGVSKCKTT